MIVECSVCRRRLDLTGLEAGVRCPCGAPLERLGRPTGVTARSCPQCGAAVPSSAASCSYCAAALTAVICPRCFGTSFPDAKHCASCGVELRRGAQALLSGTSLRCPRCKDRPSLVAVAVAETPLDRCPSCGGLFVEKGLLERLIEDRDQLGRLAPSLTGGTAPETYRELAISYLPCAACGSLMMRQNFGSASGIIVDACRLHGVWFDKDELARALAFVQQGGMEKARRKELDELKLQIQTQRQRAQQQQRWDAEPHVRESAAGELFEAMLALLEGLFRR